MSNTDHPQSEKSLGQKLLGLAGVVLIQLVVFFILLEIIARIFDPIGISYYDETARLFDSMIIEEPVGYRFPPGLDERFYGAAVQINEHGMRDRPVPPIKPPGEFRILAMGDSVIFSVGVEAEDSIPRQLEDIANATAPAGRTYRTLNMGVPSYNTEQQLEQLKQVGVNLDADAAFLFVIPNDIQEKMWVYEKRDNFIVDMAQRSYAAGLIFYVGRWAVANLLGVTTNPNKLKFNEAEAQADNAQQTSSAGAGSEDNFAKKRAMILSDPRWLAIENSLIEINRILKEQEIPLIVFYRSKNFKGTYIARTRELAQQHGFVAEGIDVFGDPRWEGESNADYVNSATDSHCNPAGCQLYATLIHEKMLAAGLIR